MPDSNGNASSCNMFQMWRSSVVTPDEKLFRGLDSPVLKFTTKPGRTGLQQTNIPPLFCPHSGHKLFPIRTHLRFKTDQPFAFIRGSKRSPHPNPFENQTHYIIRVHSCQFVVQNVPLTPTHLRIKLTTSFVSIRVNSWFKTFPSPQPI